MLEVRREAALTVGGLTGESLAQVLVLLPSSWPLRLSSWVTKPMGRLGGSGGVINLLELDACAAAEVLVVLSQCFGLVLQLGQALG